MKQPASDPLVWAAFVCVIFALLPAVMFAINFLFFRRPGRPWNRRLLPSVSVLIPARNEELSIATAMQSVLASRGVELELIVLDDGSTDRTAEIVRVAAASDSRVRLFAAPPLPDGWNGKQYACWVLASKARYEVFCFLDADVRLGSEALYRMLGEIHYLPKIGPVKKPETLRKEVREKALVSGFPRQETVTFFEWLLLPLIHFVLLGFLPLPGERWTNMPAFAVGCGQFLMVRREPYFATGGHSAISTTMHDGLLLPRLFRSRGFQTGVYDLSKDAACRMYTGADAVWSGLSKNATEGMASLLRLPIFTVLLFLGQILPLPLLVWTYLTNDLAAEGLAWIALILSYALRIALAARYRQSWSGVAVHPLGVLVLLALQWSALGRKLRGRPATWKQREYRME
ncbi:glycosyltransferase [Acidicapsa ligni]|uniref:glycosyltransferase n=1 Tax=Acidicapsa ligni TaxID=542300 RepID=UPI0021E070FC|nr:glycosyltransferase [Acidicapsa ligni]